MTGKQELRRTIQARRAAMSQRQAQSRSEQVCQRLNSLPAMQRCRQVFVYVSFGNEVRTHEWVQQLLSSGKTVAVPKMTDDQQIDPVQIRRWDELVPGRHGILAPGHDERYRGHLDVCIAPGVAFTPDGDRLGAGGGYYDRFLEGYQDLLVIGLGFEFQIVDQIPTEPHDRPVDIVVTERRTIVTTRGATRLDQWAFGSHD